jgi:hypothetical protein
MHFECNRKENIMIRSIIRTVLLAGAATATAWSVKRWLDQRLHATARAHAKEAIRDWENEGGAIASRPPREPLRRPGGQSTH